VLYAFYAHHPQPESFTRADKLYPTFVATALPRGFSGLLIAAILSAGMANLSAALNALASSSVVDFYRPYLRPVAEEKHYLRLSRVLTVFWGVVLLVIAISAQLLHESVLELALTIASVPYGSMLGIFLLGVLTKHVPGRAALAGAVLGLVVLTGIMLGNWMHVLAIAWTWYVAIGTCVTFAAGWLASVVW
jgi:solute:Na+ symporter, SSS family